MTGRPKPTICAACGEPLVRMYRVVEKVYPASGTRRTNYVPHYICNNTDAHPTIAIRIQVVSKHAASKIVATKPRRE